MSRESNYFDSTDFVVFLYRYKKGLFWVLLVSILLSGTISFCIPKQFQSTAIIYPSNTSSIAKALINSSAGIKDDIMEFGEEEKTEQMLEILNSDKVSRRIIKEFNLMKHYRIASHFSSSPLTDLEKKYKSNISYERNKNMAIEIAVLDENPDTAALIASRIVQVLDEVSNEIQKKRAKQGFEIVKQAYATKCKEIQIMEDSLALIMKKGVLNVKSQSQVYTEAYVQSVAKGNKQAAKTFEESLLTLSRYGAQQISLKDNLENERLNLSELKEKYDEAKVDAEASLQNFFVVTDPFPAEKKTYPIRWLIVSLSTLGTFFIALLSIVIFEKIQKHKTNIELTKS